MKGSIEMPAARKPQTTESTTEEPTAEATAPTGRVRKNPNYKPPVRPEDRVIDVSDIPEDRPESEELGTVIAHANDLIQKRTEIQEGLQESRMLGAMMTKRLGSREQVEWVRRYLPKKSRTDTNGESTDTAASE